MFAGVHGRGGEGAVAYFSPISSDTVVHNCPVSAGVHGRGREGAQGGDRHPQPRAGDEGRRPQRPPQAARAGAGDIGPPLQDRIRVPSVVTGQGRTLPSRDWNSSTAEGYQRWLQEHLTAAERLDRLYS